MERMKCIMFGEKILDYWDDIMKDLGDIIAIPSVAQPQDGPYPVITVTVLVSPRSPDSCRKIR